MNHRILVTGATGQVGFELARALGPVGGLVAADRAFCDLANPRALRARLDGVRPTVVCNAAAYTSVDRAEDEQSLATRINAEAVAEIGAWAAQNDAVVVHFSTDYVFDGKLGRPYREEDQPNPLNAYGRSKLAGETALTASGAAALTIRTSWVYSTRGHNFVRTMLKLAREREELRVVADQVGSPTWARWLAAETVSLIRRWLRDARGASAAIRDFQGLLHLAGGGHTTWHELATRALAIDPHRQEHRVRQVVPITSAEFGSKTCRPHWSALDCTRAQEQGIVTPDWASQLDACLTGSESRAASQ